MLSLFGQILSKLELSSYLIIFVVYSTNLSAPQLTKTWSYRMTSE
jgi:hypothetical protein